MERIAICYIYFNLDCDFKMFVNLQYDLSNKYNFDGSNVLDVSVFVIFTCQDSTNCVKRMGKKKIWFSSVKKALSPGNKVEVWITNLSSTF